MAAVDRRGAQMVVGGVLDRPSAQTDEDTAALEEVRNLEKQRAGRFHEPAGDVVDIAAVVAVAAVAAVKVAGGELGPKAPLHAEGS